MFIKRSKKKVGNKVYESIFLTESYREAGKVKQRTLCNLSKMPSEMIQVIEKSLKSQPVNHIEDYDLEAGKSIGALYVLDRIAEEFGIKKALGDSEQALLVLAMIYGRILNQGSRLSLVSWQNDQALKDVLNLDSFTEDQLYRAMDWLYSRQHTIEKTLWNQRKKKNISSLFLYDVTSSYLEGDCNELATYGYNRDKKKGKKQIVIGLLTDSEGMPVSIRVFKGNTQDPKTVETQIKTLSQNFGIETITFVGDRGMIKTDQKSLLETNNWYWITATTKPQIQTLISNNTIQLNLFSTDIAEVIVNDIRYILRKNPVRAKEIQDNRQDRLNKLSNEVKNKNEYLKEHPKAKTDVAIKNIQQWATSRNLSKFFKLTLNQREITLKINKEAIDEDSKLDGCYVIQSNIPEKNMDGQTIHNRYKDLSIIEDHFRNMKTTALEIRPIYHRKSERTASLVFIAMLSRIILMIFNEKTQSTPYSSDYKIKTLDKIQYNFLKIGDSRIKIIPKIVDEAKKSILKALNIDLPSILA